MGKYRATIIAVLIFLLSLLASRAIFIALGIVFLFLLALTFLELGAYLWGQEEFQKIKEGLKKNLCLVVAVLVAYVLIYLPIEFLGVEVFYLRSEIPSLIGVVLLGILIIVLGKIDWMKMAISKKEIKVAILGFVVIAGLVLGIYSREKDRRSDWPKIYQVNPNWGVQAQIVKIQGKNFLLTKGRIIVGDQEMTVKFWDNEMVIAEVSVPGGPRRFGEFDLRVVTERDQTSNQKPFEIRDPDTLYPSNSNEN